MTTRTHRTAAVLAAAALLGACGGQTALSQKDFIAQAEQIGAESTRKLDSFGDKPDGRIQRPAVGFLSGGMRRIVHRPVVHPSVV